MQPFLLRNFNPRKTITTLSQNNDTAVAMAWTWNIQYGLASIVLAPSVESLETSLRTNRGKAVLRVGPDGILCDLCKPWINAMNECRITDVELLAVNLYLLELFHEKLFGFYDQIDLGRLRESGAAQGSEETGSDEVLALSCQYLAKGEDATSLTMLSAAEEAPRQKLRPLRSSVLLRWLEKTFGCEVKSGKGSEVTVYRKGGKKCIVRSHGQNETVHVITLKNLLQKLQISYQEWLAKVYG